MPCGANVYYASVANSNLDAVKWLRIDEKEVSSWDAKVCEHTIENGHLDVWMCCNGPEHRTLHVLGMHGFAAVPQNMVS